MKKLAILALSFSATAGFGQLWDNGPLATGTTNSDNETAPVGTQWSEVQSVPPLQNGVLGFGANYTLTTGTGPNRLSDDFTIAGNPWDIDSFIVYGFRTGMPLTEDFATGVIQIWSGRPGDPGSTVVAGDLTTNRLVATDFTNIYRVGRGSNSLTRPIMAATLNLDVTLGPGTYWIEYGLTSNTTTVFSPLVTIPGQLAPANANARYFTSFQYFDMFDLNSEVFQAVPFQVIGQPVPEPATMAALGVGALVLARSRRRRAR